MTWYCFALGDGADAFVPRSRIMDAVQSLLVAHARAGIGHEGMAVYDRYDLEANEVTVWFPPEMSALALDVGASPCARPAPREGFSILAGRDDAWERHFPEYPRRARSE